MTYHFKVGDDVRTNDGAGRIINREYNNFHVQLQQGVYVYTAEMMKPLEEDLPSFERNVRRITDQIADLLIAKNKAYGDSALNPIRVFSKSNRIEQLNVRIDDKISRIQRGTDFEDEDTVRDLAGYLVLRLIAEESE